MPPQNKNKILVVDDEEILRFLIKTKLEEEGFEVETAMNGQDCLEKLQKFNPELILLDVKMPIMDGITTAKEIRKIKSFLKTPIVFLTGAGSTQSLHEGFEAGADEFLYKPINPDELLIRIRALLRMHKAEVEAENLSKNFHYLLVQDFLNYSTAIKLPLLMLADETLGPLNEQQKEIVQMALKALNENIQLLQETALITKLDPKNIALNRTPTDLREIINESIKNNTTLLKRKNLNLIKNFPSSEIILNLDKEHFKQSMSLLFNYVIERSKNKTDLQLGLKIPEFREKIADCVEFYIKDTGETLSKEEQHLLIDRYEQARLNKITVTKNLSLTICKLIIEAHDGKFWCESTDNGNYYRFSIPFKLNNRINK